MNERELEALDVHLGEQLAGRLVRTAHGARFEYDASWAGRHAGDPDRAIACRMPVRSEPYDSPGVNLHPFFAGLLPEGLRLRALQGAVKTSEDDLFSLLAAIGADTVGDVSVTEPGASPVERAEDTGERDWTKLRFRELLERSLSPAGVAAHSSTAGIQPKVSAAMISLPLRRKQGATHCLLKLAPPEYPRLVENEAFFMDAARAAGIVSAKVELVHDADGEAGLVVERFDRERANDGSVRRVHQEDACQLLNRYPADKYRLKLQDLFDALEVTSAPLVAQKRLLELQVFSYLIANGDLHAKNVSVQRRAGQFTFAPAYDLLSTLPYGDAKLALTLEGRDENLDRKHFIAFGERNGLSAASVRRSLSRIVDALGPWVARLPEIGLDARKTAHLERTLLARLAALDPRKA
ncbi:MAG: HipA domain-containing protein [Planctomycetota bacterium]|nr:HipA domain-containing protein [Planctomycetota bacterium]